MVVGAKVCELTNGFLWFVCGLYVGILTSPLSLSFSIPTTAFHIGCHDQAKFRG